MSEGREEPVTLHKLSSHLWEDICSQPPPTSSAQLWKEHLTIRQILDKMRQMNPPQNLFPGRKSREEELTAFLKWADKARIETNRVTVANFEPFGFGLKATGDIEEKDVLVKVPRKAMVTVDTVRKSAMLKRAYELDPIVKNMDNVALALYVLCEKLKGTESYWHPYLNVLPSEFATPLFFTAEEFESLKPSSVFETALKMYRNIARQFAYFHLMLVPRDNRPRPQVLKPDKKPKEKTISVLEKTPLTFANFTFDAYKWAVSAVTTRINLVPSEDLTNADGSPTQIPSLIPLLDMANHGPRGVEDALSVHYSTADRKALCTATDDYSFGDHVTIFYGPRTSPDHLVHNGFVPDDNEFDYYTLKLGIAKTDKIYDLRVAALKHVGLQPTEVFEIRLQPDPVPQEMYRFARIFVSDLEEGQLQPADSNDNRIKAWKYLQARFELLLSGYARNRPQENLPESGPIVQILRFLKGEEAILYNASKFAAAKVAEFQSQNVDADVRDLNLDHIKEEPFKNFETLD